MTTAGIARRPKYVALFSMGLSDALAYRTSAAISWVINGWSVLIVVYVWYSLFAQDGAPVAQFDWQAMKTYLILAHAVNWFMQSDVSWIVADAVQNGNIVTDLTRPADYMLSKFSQAIGGSLVNGTIGTVILFGSSIIFLHLQAPASPAAAGLFILACVLGYGVNFLISYLMGLSTCWLTNNQGLSWVLWYAGRILAGTVIPISLFPGWLQTVAWASPFQATVSTPLLIYLGHDQQGGALGLIGVQVAWIIGLGAFSRWLYARAMRRLEIQGG